MAWPNRNYTSSLRWIEKENFEKFRMRIIDCIRSTKTRESARRLLIVTDDLVSGHGGDLEQFLEV